MWKVPNLDNIQATLKDSSSPIGMRMRAAYYAKQLFLDLQKKRQNEHAKDENHEYNDDRSRQQQQWGKNIEKIISLLCDQLFVVEHGSLLRHEFAYVLGQMKTDHACSALEELLTREGDCVIVRHEAAEALGAIASLKSKKVLESTRVRYECTLHEISDTCLLALNRLEHVNSNEKNESLAVGCACMLAPYNSIDPVEVDPAHASLSTVQLGNILMDDTNNDLIERYRAMFSLRNRGGTESIHQLCRVLTTDQSSPLLRHEVAFVLGQLQHPASISALVASLSRKEEHAMVRHESAEALGAIEGSAKDWQKIESVLNQYKSDPDPVVAESCLVALDAVDYWGNDKASFKNYDDEINITESKEAALVNNQSAGSFGKRKHTSTEDACEVRRRVLAQHFNVVETA